MNLLDLLPFIIVIFGTILLIKLKFFFILHPVRTFKRILTSLDKKGAKKALMLSLAGTLGVGNIVGIAFGISVGGAGSVFWLIISAFFSMSIKYSEAAIAADLRENERGGMMYVIKKCFPKKLSCLSYIYAFFCLLLSLSMGSALQARSAIESVSKENGSIFYVSALIFTVLTAISIFGGGAKIEKITLYLIPIASLTYIILSLGVIFLNFSRIPYVISLIFNSAFSPEAALGGTGGFLISAKIREGFCRGLLSNEAGAGTSSMAHSRNQDDTPSAVGILGITEVFVDTVLLCTLTALTVLLSVPSPEQYSSGIEIISAAISTLGNFSTPLLSFSVIAFAYSTVICWYYYGETSIEFITKKKTKFFPFVFLASLFLGCIFPSDFLITVSDYLLFFMTILSLLAVMKNSDRLVNLSEKEGIITKRGYGKRR